MFLDALDISDEYIDSFEFMNLVGSRKIEFHKMVVELMELLVFTKKIKFDKLINFEDFQFPVDRIMNFIKIYKNNLENN